jgi:type I restriction enzyme S subunit
MRVALPPMDEQKEISSALYTLDEKIETNNRISNTLEEMAQALFKSWFVDFDPYEKFKDSELGEIPEKFEEKELGKLLSLEYGDGLSKDDRDGGKYPVYGSNGANGSHSEYLVEGPGVIVGRKGTIGTVNYEPENFWCIDTTFYVEPKQDFDMLFYYHLLKNGVALKHLGSDSAVPGLNRNIAYDQKVALPPKEEVERFIQTIKPFYKKKKDIKEENQYLEDLRETLLPKLMSGEIRVNVDGDE